MIRALAIDVGTVRVGLALSDPVGISAQPLTVLRRQKKPAADLEAMREIVTKHEVTILVIGLPYNFDGTEGPAAEMARAYATLLEPLGLPIEFVDERLSSAMAEQTLLAADVRRSKRKEVRDKLAAAVILQSWLDRRGRNSLV